MARPWFGRTASPATKVVVAVVALLAVAMPLIGAFHRGTHLTVATAPVTDGEIVRRITATGTLQAVTTVQVGAQVSGTVGSLEADYNSIVHAGQIVAKLDPSLFQAAYA